jgi:flagellar protein FlaG
MSVGISAQGFVATPQLFDGVRTNVNQNAGTAPPAVPVATDAQVVSKVASTEIKPSNISQATEHLKATIEQAANDLQNYVRSSGRNLNISVDQNSGYQVVRVMNADTGELIRQMPSPEFLKLAESLPQTNTGLINQKA